MNQNRKPPAYVEYAANMLASRNFRLMNIAERGLLYTIRLECWENKQVPSSSYDLAKYISCDVSEVKAALTDRVKAFLHEKNGSLTCPDLEDYRKYLDDRRAKQSRGGQVGAARTNAKKNASREANLHIETDSGNSQVTRRGSDESLVKQSTVKQIQEQPIRRSKVVDSFVTDYESVELATEVKPPRNGGGNKNDVRRF